MVMKECIICGKTFDARGSAKCCSPECSKVNNSERMKQYYDDNREQILEQKKQYYDDNHEQIREYQKQYRDDNREQLREQNKQYYYDNREQMLEQSKQYYEDNREQVLEYQKQWHADNPEYDTQRTQKIIAELNDQYDGDLNLILEKCPTGWMEREAKMLVWFNESYSDGMIAKIKSTPVCEVTGETDNLVIHHLWSFNTHPELGNVPNNMVRINKEIHKEFHNLYGYGNNTPEQWFEFLEKLNFLN